MSNVILSNKRSFAKSYVSKLWLLRKSLQNEACGRGLAIESVKALGEDSIAS